MKLSVKGIRYSSAEQKIFEALSSKPKTTTALADIIYSNGNRPFNDRGSVLSIIKKLTHKVRTNKEPFIIRSTKRRGPYPVSFWIEKHDTQSQKSSGKRK